MDPMGKKVSDEMTIGGIITPLIVINHGLAKSGVDTIKFPVDSYHGCHVDSITFAGFFGVNQNIRATKHS